MLSDAKEAIEKNSWKDLQKSKLGLVPGIPWLDPLI